MYPKLNESPAVNLNRVGLQNRTDQSMVGSLKTDFLMLLQLHLQVEGAISQNWIHIQLSHLSSTQWWAFFSPPSPCRLTWASGPFLWTASWGKIARINGALTQCRGKADPAFIGRASVTSVSSEILAAAAFPPSHGAALCAWRNSAFCRRRVYALAPPFHCASESN